MQTFKDAKGTDRSLSLTVGKSLRIGSDPELNIDFIDGDPAKIGSELMSKGALQVELIWHLLDDRGSITLVDGCENQREVFEDHLDGEAFSNAKRALISEVDNFIQSTRPESVPVFREAIELITSQFAESSQHAVSLLRSKEIQEEFSKTREAANSKIKEVISKGASKLLEDIGKGI
jgi:hypothetical protein